LRRQVGENLTYCKEYNGQTLSTRGDATQLDKNAKLVADFLANNPAASENCKVCSSPHIAKCTTTEFPATNAAKAIVG